MKYGELVQFEPINEIVKFDRLSDAQYREEMIKSYVFSEHYENVIIPEICKVLDYTSGKETYGLQIVGTYGTGKSHLMSLISLVAENADYLPLVQSAKAQKALSIIAGKYKIVRFELGSEKELWNLVCYQIDKNLEAWGINYSIANDHKNDMYKDKLGRLMAQFEEKFPDKGMMIVIDEMLSYLKGRATADKLNRDLAVLQALGEYSDHSKFRMVCGVQEMIYTVPEFQFAATMLGRVNHRYRQIEITKQDVQFVTEQRILRKTDEQKAYIREHLVKFTTYFPEMHANLDAYVNLFPVHPSFFENFQLIKIENSQREILKTISEKFAKIENDDVPDSYPGLICYDSYWDDLNVAALKVYPDVNSVSDIIGIINQKIAENFTGGRRNKLPLAYRIANACAVKVLQSTLDKTNGTTAEQLVDDLCYVEANCDSREFLIDTMNTVASQIVTSTVGQYFEQNNVNQEYHIRVEGGINYEQKIKDFVSTMSDSNKDSYFYGYLVEKLPIEVEQYRREFKIFQHSIVWQSHKVMVDGYIFMGNPSERDTTHPQQNFYIYFMPIFDVNNMNDGDEPDSVYIHFDKVSEAMKECLELYAASEALMASVDSSQKGFYQQYRDRYINELDKIFERDFVECTEVFYQGQKQNISPLMLAGGSKEEVISDIASTLLETHFCSEKENYPKFTLLHNTITTINRATIIKGALQKIADPTQPNRDGEAILAGLGLLQENQLSIEGSIYAVSISQQLNEKGEGKVLNRDEIIHRFYEDWASDWRSNDYNIEADLEFLVLATMVAMGEIEIVFDGGKTINATNLREIVSLPGEAFYSFSNIRKPKDMNLSAVRELFLGITGRDMTSQLNNPEIYAQLISEAKALAARSAKALQTVTSEFNIQGVKLFANEFVNKAKIDLTALKGLCDKLQTYTSQARMRNLPDEWTAEQLHRVLDAKGLIDIINKSYEVYEEIYSRINYLNQATQYIPEDNILKAEIDQCLGRFSEIVEMDVSDPQIQEYITCLDTIKERYIEWYLSEYKRFHISELQLREKKRLLNDTKNIVCQIISNADKRNKYFSTFDDDYAKWIGRMSLLSTGDSNVRNNLSNTPYWNFNPKSLVGQEFPSIDTLQNELFEIFGRADEAFHDILKDDGLLANKQFLDKEEVSLLEEFNRETTQLSESNAEKLYEIIHKLHQNIKAVTITMDDMRKVLNRPMTPSDAVRAFSDFIKKRLNGTNADDTRIILK